MSTSPHAPSSFAHSLALASEHQIYREDSVAKAEREVSGSNNEEPLRYLKRMRERGTRRLLVKPGSSQTLTPLYDSCPNFSEVIEDLEKSISLSLLARGALTVMPILLLGDAGVGKTHFAKSLAKVIGTDSEFISMNSLTAGFVLTGGSSSWKGSKPGKVAMKLVDGMYANPVMLLDEIDKASGDRQSDPVDALYQLLEPETASHFHDEYLDVDVDCSRIVWVLTANDVRAIPKPLLSRIAVYEIEKPTAEQSANVAQKIYAGIVAEYSLPFDPQLSENVRVSLSSVSPRDMRRAMMDALGVAAHNNRNHLVASDFKAPPAQKRSIGF